MTRTFAANVKAKGADLKTIDFVVPSHRHPDYIAGKNYALSVNMKRMEKNDWGAMSSN